MTAVFISESLVPKRFHFAFDPTKIYALVVIKLLKTLSSLTRREKRFLTVKIVADERLIDPLNLQISIQKFDINIEKGRNISVYLPQFISHIFVFQIGFFKRFQVKSDKPQEIMVIVIFFSVTVFIRKILVHNAV